MARLEMVYTEVPIKQFVAETRVSERPQVLLLVSSSCWSWNECLNNCRSFQNTGNLASNRRGIWSGLLAHCWLFYIPLGWCAFLLQVEELTIEWSTTFGRNQTVQLNHARLKPCRADRLNVIVFPSSVPLQLKRPWNFHPHWSPCHVLCIRFQYFERDISALLPRFHGNNERKWLLHKYHKGGRYGICATQKAPCKVEPLHCNEVINSEYELDICPSICMNNIISRSPGETGGWHIDCCPNNK